MTILEWLSGLAWPIVLIGLLVLCLLTFEIANSLTRHFDPNDRT